MALKHEFSVVTPRLQDAIRSTPIPQGMQMTSLISGPHTGLGHAQGRAVDVSLPHTQSGWQFVVNAIKSGKFSAIGSTSMVVNDAAMQALAQKYGVDLFLDEGTGSHVHLEVAP